MERELVESQGLLDAEADHFPVPQQSRKKGSTSNKSSNEASTKDLTGKENHKQRILGFSARPKLHQTYSTHYLEPAGFGWMNPIILINKRADISNTSSTSSRDKTPRSKKPEIDDRMNSGKHPQKLCEEVSYSQVKEGQDVLEVLKENTDLLVGISHHFPGKQTSKTVKLMKSGSFPVSDSPRTRYLRFSTLDHKQKEVWSFRKGKKSVAGIQSSKGSDSQRLNRLVMNRLKDFKQRIKQAIKESKKCVNHTIQDSIKDATDNDISNGRLNRMRRTKSINESLDRYTKLFEHSVSKEADSHHSKSLKLSNEEQVPSRELHGPKFFRRISSLSFIDSFCSLLHAVSGDALSLEMPIRSILNYDANKEIDAHNEPKSITIHEDIDKFELVEAVIEAELQEKMREGNNHDSSSTYLSMDTNGEDIAKTCNLAMEKISPHQKDNLSRELARPTSDLSDLTSTAERPISEGTELNPPNLPEGETESLTFLKEKPTMLFESDKEGDPSYNYVKDILELSGFLQNECLHSWYSPDQPLNPSLFKELETILHPELQCSIDELGTNCDDHQLVFGLVNEALVEISEKTSIYFPKPFNCCINLMFKGNIVLREVWRKVGGNLAFQMEHDQSLDDFVGRDMEKDVWMIIKLKQNLWHLSLKIWFSTSF